MATDGEHGAKILNIKTIVTVEYPGGSTETVEVFNVSSGDAKIDISRGREYDREYREDGSVKSLTFTGEDVFTVRAWFKRGEPLEVAPPAIEVKDGL